MEAATKTQPAPRKLMELLHDDNASLAQVTSTLAREPDLATRLISEAARARCGGRRRIRDLDHAVLLLGLRRCAALVATT